MLPTSSVSRSASRSVKSWSWAERIFAFGLSGSGLCEPELSASDLFAVGLGDFGFSVSGLSALRLPALGLSTFARGDSSTSSNDRIHPSCS